MYIVFSKPNCHQCETAINLLRGTDEIYEIKKIGMGSTIEEAFDLISKSNAPDFTPRSMPIIFKKNGDDIKVYETIIDFENDFLVI